AAVRVREAVTMIHFVRENMAPLMFGGMVLFMLIGYPAAFSLAATGLFFGFIGIELGLIRPDFLGNLTYQLFGIVSNDLLLAIPFFTFMGAILERCGLAEDLLDSIGQLFGPVRGGLSYAVIFVGAILGAITGTVAASVIAMGVIAMTPMLKYGYSTRHTMGVIALAASYGTLTWSLLYQGMSTTMRITAMVVYILIGARTFSLVFQGVGGKEWIEHLLTSLPGGQIGFLVFVNVFIFVIAFFLDFFEIAFIIIPLLAPVADKLGIDLIWFGVLICANIQTSFMHPPFGFALFYLRGIAPRSIKTSEIYWGAIPWVVLQVILVIIVIFWPGSVTYWIDRGARIDPSKIQIDIPQPDMPPPLDFGPPSRP